MDAFEKLQKSISQTEEFAKAHVKEHIRRTKSGGVATVKEHEDKRHPFSLTNKPTGKITFHDHHTGEELHDYEGPFHKDGDKDTLMHTWKEGGERAFSMKPRPNGLPGLKDWNTYHGDGKHYNYDIHHDGVKYSIAQINNRHGRHQGYSLTAFGAKDMPGHANIDENGDHRSFIGHTPAFRSPAAAAKAAKAHYAKHGGGVYHPKG